MATIETVNIDDVFPLVDEFGNDLASRDYSTKENKAYVKELARSMRQKGIPDEMVTLVRDGGIYRIKAGNSRVMAMRELGTKSFPAIVEDESTLQEAIETVIRTNTKKKYEAVEESRFVRQLAMFANDEHVAEVAGIEANDVAKIRKAATAVQDAADDMSLLRLITIGEFSDDPEAVEALTNCSEREYPTIAKRFEAKRKKAQSASALVKAIESRGMDVVKDAKGMKLVANVNKPGQIPDELPEGAVAMPHSIPGFYMILAPMDEQRPEPEDKQAEEAEKQARAMLYEEGTARRRKWLAEHLGSPLHGLKAFTRGRADLYHPKVEDFMEATGLDSLEIGPIEIVYAFEYSNSVKHVPNIHAAQRFVALLNAMEVDGYEPDEDEQALYQKAIDYLEEIEK